MGQQAKKNFPMGYLSPIKKKNLPHEMWVRALVVHSRCHRAVSLLDKKLRSIYCVWSPAKGVPARGFRGNRVMNFSVASGLGEALPSLLASLFRAV